MKRNSWLLNRLGLVVCLVVALSACGQAVVEPGSGMDDLGSQGLGEVSGLTEIETDRAIKGENNLSNADTQNLKDNDLGYRTHLDEDINLSNQSIFEIKSLANDLIYRADMLYQLFYGEEGFRKYFGEVIETQDEAGTVWLSTPKCQSIEQLKAMAQEVYSEDYCKQLFDVFEWENSKFSYMDSILHESTQVGGVGNVNYLLMASMELVSVSDRKIVVQLLNDLPPGYYDKNKNATTQTVQVELVWEKDRWLLKKYPL